MKPDMEIPGTMTNDKTWTRENAVTPVVFRVWVVNPIPPVYHIVIFLRRFMIDYMYDDGFSLADKRRPGRN